MYRPTLTLSSFILLSSSLLLLLLLLEPKRAYAKIDQNDVGIVEFGRLFLKSIVFCHNRKNVSITDCAKESTLLSLDSLTRSDKPVELITDTISLVKTGRPDDVSSSSYENRSGKYLLSIIDETSIDNRTLILDDLLRRALFKFADTRSINIRFPISILNVLKDESTITNDREDEGSLARGKKDKGNGMLAMGAMMAGTAMAMKIAALAAMSGKALMTSLMAFMLAALAALKKHSGGDSHGATYEVINVPSSGHGHHHARSDNSQAVKSSTSYYSPLDYDLYAKQR